MKEFLVGSVVEFTSNGDVDPFFAGKEGTILEAQGCRDAPTMDGVNVTMFRYLLMLEGYEHKVVAKHSWLRLKRFPDPVHTDCQRFMSRVLNPLPPEELNERG